MISIEWVGGPLDGTQRNFPGGPHDYVEVWEPADLHQVIEKEPRDGMKRLTLRTGRVLPRLTKDGYRLYWAAIKWRDE